MKLTTTQQRQVIASVTAQGLAISTKVTECGDLAATVWRAHLAVEGSPLRTYAQAESIAAFHLISEGYTVRSNVADELWRAYKAPYPFCRSVECAGKGYCPREIACND